MKGFNNISSIVKSKETLYFFLLQLNLSLNNLLELNDEEKSFSQPRYQKHSLLRDAFSYPLRFPLRPVVLKINTFEDIRVRI